MNKFTALATALAVTYGAATAQAMAQEVFPSKAVTVIVPFQAGQGVDVMARALAVAPRGTL